MLLSVFTTSNFHIGNVNDGAIRPFRGGKYMCMMIVVAAIEGPYYIIRYNNCER